MNDIVKLHNNKRYRVFKIPIISLVMIEYQRKYNKNNNLIFQKTIM